MGLIAGASLLVACRAEEAKPAAKEPYKVGFAMAVTGPVASTYAPIVEGFRIYIQKLNDAGGINGHPVQLILEDSQANPSRSAAFAKKFVEVDKVILMGMSATSANIKPMLEEAKKAGIPFIIHTGCPDETLPPDPDPLAFCSITIAGGVPSHLPAEIRFIQDQAKGQPVKLALSAMDIPVSRIIVEFAKDMAIKAGMEAKMVVIPFPPPADLTPFATELVRWGANWATGGAPEEATLALFEAMVKQGWKGTWVGDAPLGYDDNLERLKSDQFVAFFGAHPFADNLPIHREIIEAARKYGASQPPTRMIHGWTLGMIVEAALRQCGWPCDSQKLLQAMNNLEVDFGAAGIWPKGAKFRWTASDHIGPRYWRPYNWDKAQGKIVPAGPWYKLDHKGKREGTVETVE